MKISAILIDDERKALATLRSKIERKCSNINIIAETQSPVAGLDLIKKHKPQLVFLDIAMPEMSGFDMLEQIKNPDFEIIFVTAFDEFAIEAINFSAIGYLMKPVNKEELVIAVNKAIVNIKNKSALEKNKLLIENLGIHAFQKKKIVIPSVKGLDFIVISEIIYCEGVDGYTKVHIKEKKSILSSYSIGHFKDLLADHSFYLVHKSYVINLNHIVTYLNEGYVILDNNVNIPVARSKRSDFLNSLKS